MIAQANCAALLAVLALANGAASPCYQRQSWMTWPAADVRLTNNVSARPSVLNADWQSVRLQWMAESNVLYQVQFCTNLARPFWQAYANVRLTNAPYWAGPNWRVVPLPGLVTCDFPVFFGQ